MNKGKEEGRGVVPRPPLALLREELLEPYFTGLINPQVAGMVASWGSDGLSSLLPAALKS